MKTLVISLGASIGALVLLTAVLLVWPVPDMPDRGVAGDFLIRGVTVVDVQDGTLLADRDVVVEGGVIISIEPAVSAGRREAVIEVDGRGRYLMPGLWDMHTHSSKLAPQYYHPLLIANGVTGVREMWGCMSKPDSFVGCIDDRKRWNDELENHGGLSPRFVLHSSFQINGGNEVPGGYPDFFRARDAQEARQLVEYYKGQGTDFLKTYSELSAAAYRALSDEARRQGLALAGHRPFSVSLEQTLSAGQVSIEHPRLFLLECYRGAAEFRASADPLVAYDHDLRQRLVDEHDEQRCAALIRIMAASETWWVPTLQVLRMSALARDESFRNDRRLRYVPYLIRQGMWMPDADRAAAQDKGESGRDVYAQMYRMALAHVGQAHAAGVRLLVGTDAGDTYVFPGFSVHAELAEFVAAGIPPGGTLKAATIDAATFSGLEAQYGSIEVGKIADMLLLDANPLADIHNTRQISALFFNGRLYDRAALDELLSFAEKQSGSVRTNLQLLWRALNSPIVRLQLAD